MRQTQNNFPQWFMKTQGQYNIDDSSLAAFFSFKWLNSFWILTQVFKKEHLFLLLLTFRLTIHFAELPSYTSTDLYFLCN